MGEVNIIGGGPIGLHCAALLAEEGFETSVFEEHSNIGRPVQCAGLVSSTGIEELGIELGNSVVNEVKGARIFSPGGQSLEIKKKKTVAYVIDRVLFDQMFYKKAKRLGCDIRLESKLIDVRNSSLFMQTKGRGEFIKSQITVGADGVHSIVRHAIFPKLFEKNFVQAFQVKAAGKFDKEFVELHFGEFAPGFFAWVVPESSNVARIGLAVSPGKNAGDSMKEFLKKKMPNIRILSKGSALIPIAPPAKELVSGNAMLVGDAAAQTKATTGGGIIFGLKAAKACSETISNHLKHKKPLTDYSKNLQAVNKDLAMHWKLYSYINGLNPRQFDSLIAKAKNAGVEEFLAEYGDMDKPSLFMKKMLFKPKMWGLLPAVLKSM